MAVISSLLLRPSLSSARPHLTSTSPPRMTTEAAAAVVSFPKPISSCFLSPSTTSSPPLLRSTHSRRLPRAATNPTASSGGGGADDDDDLAGGGGLLEAAARVVEALSMAFPVWIASACLLGLWRPTTFSWADRGWQIVLLTLTMLGMGMTLTLEDLKGAFLMPKEMITGFALQYTVMPLSGFFVSKLLKLPSYYAAGLILVSCCPGVQVNIHDGDPCYLFGTDEAQVDEQWLEQVVLVPVLVGAVLNQYCKQLVEFVSPMMPLIAVACVAILCGSAISQNASAILSSGLQVALAACFLHASGFFCGFVLSRMLGVDVSSSRTISIEVGMQNSVLGIILASQHFSNPLTAVPCAVSSVCHSIYGSILAGIWRTMPPSASKKRN